jgi:ABC-type transport system involved in cytochrome c biogenesis permease component
MNPIFALEWRSRWRDKRSFWLLFVLCALMCLLVAFVYNSSIMSRGFYDSIYGMPSQDEARQMAATGKTLFRTIAYLNGFAWLFVAPVLASTPIARERERGLLESLQLSQMGARSQILARFGSHLLFLMVLQMICIPIYGMAIAFGGVTHVEIIGASFCILLNAIFGIGLGMWVSARSYRPMSALFTTLAIVAVWSILTFQYVSGAVGVWATGFWPNLPLILHPQGLLFFVTDPNSIRYAAPKPFYEFIFISCAFHAVLLTFFLLDSARMSAKNFPPPAWQTKNTVVARWKAKLEAQRIERERQKQIRDAKEKVAGALVADLPLEKFVRFQNPVLAREVKARFRFRRTNLLVTLIRGAAFICGVGLWLLAAFCLLDPMLDDGVAHTLLTGLWLSGTAFIALAASSSFVREIESGTWEGLHLSLLTTREILWAKFTSSPVAFLYYTFPLWLLVPCLLKVLLPLSTVMAVCVLFCSFAVASAVGLYCSRRNRTSVAAACWTFGVLFCLWGAMPWLGDALGVSGWYYRAKAAVLVTGNLYDMEYAIGSPYYANNGYYPAYRSLMIYSPPAILEQLSLNKNRSTSSYTYSYSYPYGMDEAAQSELRLRTASVYCFFSILLVLFLLRELRFDLDTKGGRKLLGINIGRVLRR